MRLIAQIHSIVDGRGHLLRAVQVVALGVVLCFTLGASESGARYNNLSHRLMCNCGCSELLGECSHVGCQQSESLGRELRLSIEGGKPDQEILTAFSDEYGPTILAAPTTKGFNLIVWIVPFALLVLGVVGIVLFIHNSGRKMALAGAAPAQPELDPSIEAMRERVRRETEGEGRS
jgi:cytochrome c-type biogenesis protein CcmH